MVEYFKVEVVDAFEYQTRDFGGRIANNIEEADDVGTTCQVLEDLDLSFNLLLLDGLENLDYALLIVSDIDPLEYLSG